MSDTRLESKRIQEVAEDQEEEGDSNLLLEQHRVRTVRDYKRSNWFYLGVVMGCLTLLFVGLVIALSVGLSQSGDGGNRTAYERAMALLSNYPLIDG